MGKSGSFANLKTERCGEVTLLGLGLDAARSPTFIPPLVPSVSLGCRELFLYSELRGGIHVWLWRAEPENVPPVLARPPELRGGSAEGGTGGEGEEEAQFLGGPGCRYVFPRCLFLWGSGWFLLD
jgi:hypothetical protein